MGTNLILFVQKKQTRTHLIFFNKKHHILQVVIKYLNRATYIYLYINFSVFSEKDEKKKMRKSLSIKKMGFVLKNHSASVLLYTSIENYNLRKKHNKSELQKSVTKCSNSIPTFFPTTSTRKYEEKKTTTFLLHCTGNP